MIIGGIALGAVFWFGFAYMIKRIKNNEPVEILLTMLLAHFTFLVADLISANVIIGWFGVKISGVIATAYAAIIMGNYGRTKISPKVEEAMEKFWSFFAFAANSLVFILIGLMINDITIPFNVIIWPIIVLLVITSLARAISVYLPINILNLLRIEKRIPMAWQHLLARWSLRWALAFMMVLLIDNSFTIPGWEFDFSIKAFLMTIVITKILYSLFVKGTTITLLLKKLHIWDKSPLDDFEQYQSELLIYHKILEKIEFMKTHYHLTDDNYTHLKNTFTRKIENTRNNICTFMKKTEDAERIIFQAISLEALGVEKQYVKRLYHTNEMSENLYLHLIYKIDTQIDRIHEWQAQIKGIEEKTTSYDMLTKINMTLHRGTWDYKQAYIKNRTKEIIISRVLRYLDSLKSMECGYPSRIVEEVESLYAQFHAMAVARMQEIYAEHKDDINILNNKLFEKWLMDQEEKIITDLQNKEIISSKIYQKFLKEIEMTIHEKIVK